MGRARSNLHVPGSGDNVHRVLCSIQRGWFGQRELDEEFVAALALNSELEQ